MFWKFIKKSENFQKFSNFFIFIFMLISRIEEKMNTEKTNKLKSGKFARFSRKLVHVFQGKKKAGFKKGNETRSLKMDF